MVIYLAYTIGVLLDDVLFFSFGYGIISAPTSNAIEYDFNKEWDDVFENDSTLMNDEPSSIEILTDSTDLNTLTDSTDFEVLSDTTGDITSN